MKIKLVLFLLLYLFYSTIGLCQVTISNNTPGIGIEFLGWNNLGTIKDLEIKNESGLGIDFKINSTRAMYIDVSGNIGFGNFTPLMHMHSYSGNVDNFFRMSTQTSGITGVNGFDIELNNTDNRVVFHQNENAPIQYRMHDQYLGGKVIRAEWTSGQAMLENDPSRNPTDGLRIRNPGYFASTDTPTEAMDLWVGENHSTHIRFDGNGLVQGLNLRFEQFGRLNGFWFNAAPLQHQTDAGVRARYFFNIDSVEIARFSNTNTSNRGFMRIGEQPAGGTPAQLGIEAARRLEVYDTADDPQFRITESDATRYCDFQVRNTGDLYINPRNGANDRRIGINIQGPQASVDINGINAGTLPQLRLTQISGASGMFTDLHTTTAGNLNIRPQGGGIEKNVGINVSTPIAKLHIQSDNLIPVFRLTNSSSLDILNIDDNSTFTFKSTISNGSVGAFYFEDAPTSTSNIAQGLTSKAINPSTASGYCNTYGGSFWADQQSTNSSTTVGLYAMATTNTTAGASEIIGVKGFTSASNSNQHVQGGNFTAQGSGYLHHGIAASANGSNGINIGVQGYTPNTNAGTNCGVKGLASDANTENCGVYGSASGSATSNFGIAGYATGGTNNYSIYGYSPGGVVGWNNTAGYFNGDTYCSGGTFTSSDKKLKININPLQDAMSLILQFESKSYDFDQQGYPGMSLPNQTQFGFLAQDVEQVVPQMVRSFVNPPLLDSAGNEIAPAVEFKGVNYDLMIPILTAAIQELKQQVDSLQALVVGSSFQAKPTAIQRVTLSDSQAILLHQNEPNPFSESTIIRFDIPESIKNARIMFTDTKGTVLKSAIIETRGEGNLEVFASDLSSGMYTYTLVCDGKVVDSKKMVKQ